MSLRHVSAFYAALEECKQVVYDELGFVDPDALLTCVEMRHLDDLDEHYRLARRADTRRHVVQWLKRQNAPDASGDAIQVQFELEGIEKLPAMACFWHEGKQVYIPTLKAKPRHVRSTIDITSKHIADCVRVNSSWRKVLDMMLPHGEEITIEETLALRSSSTQQH
jgi:hypothetical protein